jgi:hypothetical protein
MAHPSLGAMQIGIGLAQADLVAHAVGLGG